MFRTRAEVAKSALFLWFGSMHAVLPALNDYQPKPAESATTESRGVTAEASQGRFGVYAGATVHEVAEALAAGRAISQRASDTAVITKMLRVLAPGDADHRLAATGRRESEGPHHLPVVRILVRRRHIPPDPGESGPGHSDASDRSGYCVTVQRHVCSWAFVGFPFRAAG